MEKFYKIEIQTMPDGTTAIGATAEYTDSMDAEAAFHTNCAAILSAIKGGTLKAGLVKIISGYGADLKTAYYHDEDAAEE